MTPPFWMIKLLSGAHTGAQMQLENRTYRVGTVDECDIILTDNQLPDVAFDLIVDEETLQLKVQADDLKLMCEGSALEPDIIAVEAYKIFSIGTLYFCFGPANEQWPELSVPTHQAPVTAVKQTVEDETDSNSDSVKPFRRRNQILLQLAMFFLVIFSFVLSSSPNIEAGTIEKPLDIDLQEQLSIHDAFDDLDITFTSNADGQNRWNVSGYLQTEADLERLEDQLRSLSVNALLDVRVMAHIKKSTQALLKQFQMEHLSVVNSGHPGALSIIGVVSDLERWQKMKTILLSDIAGLNAIYDRVESKANRLRLIQQWIIEEGLQEDVLVNGDNGRLSVTSASSIEQSAAWRRIAEKFEAQFGTELILTELTGIRPSIDIRSVSLGPFPYLVLTNGHRYSIGSHISDGYFLESIESGFVLLKRNDEFLKFPVGSS